MAYPIIRIQNLVKKFTYESKNSKKGFLTNLFKPQKSQITAVDDINLIVGQGETLAFIGPNGAGKSTTIKMLTGILTPTSGSIEVCGLDPIISRDKLIYQIGCVFGQRSQLVFNLPIPDSFGLFAKLYEIPIQKFNEKSAQLYDLFDLHDFLKQPVRKLSLGQRMRAEVALALLHEPRIIFLDEPTIGLDVVAKANLRDTLARLNKELETTIFLTSHDVGDIEALCSRTVIINQGKIIIDEATENLSKNYLKIKKVHLELNKQVPNFEIENAKITKLEDKNVFLEVDTSQASINSVISNIIQKYDVSDIDIENINLEEIIKQIYQGL